MENYVRNDKNINYDIFEFNGIRFRGPKPASLEKNKYIVCVGASQTFGRYCENPYPKILSETLGFPVLNMGYGGASINYFLKNDKLMDIINNSKMIILQVMSARGERNSRFESINGTCVMRDLQTGKNLHIDDHHCLLTSNKNKKALIPKLIFESRSHYINSYQEFFNRLQKPCILFYFSKIWPIANEINFNFNNRKDIQGEFPHWVNREVWQAISSIFIENAMCVKSPINNNGNYYPTEEMHKEAAKILYDKIKNCENQIKLWILAEARSGSTFLSEILNNLFSFKEEQFYEFISDRDEIYQKKDMHKAFKLKRTKVVHYCWKKHHETNDICQILDNHPDMKFVRIIRKDKISQSVSNFVANQTNQWLHYKNNRDNYLKHKVLFKKDNLLKTYHLFSGLDVSFEKEVEILKNLCLDITYEEFMRDHVGTIKKVLKHIGHNNKTDQEIRDAIANVKINRSERPEYDYLKRKLGVLVEDPNYTNFPHIWILTNANYNLEKFYSILNEFVSEQPFFKNLNYFQDKQIINLKRAHLDYEQWKKFFKPDEILDVMEKNPVVKFVFLNNEGWEEEKKYIPSDKIITIKTIELNKNPHMAIKRIFDFANYENEYSVMENN